MNATSGGTDFVGIYLSEISNHGATVLEGEGSYEHCERNVVYSVVASSESGRVVKAVKDADNKAFVSISIHRKCILSIFIIKPKV